MFPSCNPISFHSSYLAVVVVSGAKVRTDEATIGFTEHLSWLPSWVGRGGGVGWGFRWLRGGDQMLRHWLKFCLDRGAWFLVDGVDADLLEALTCHGRWSFSWPQGMGYVVMALEVALGILGKPWLGSYGILLCGGEGPGIVACSCHRCQWSLV